jgi:hypothetical protein
MNDEPAEPAEPLHLTPDAPGGAEPATWPTSPSATPTPPAAPDTESESETASAAGGTTATDAATGTEGADAATPDEVVDEPLAVSPPPGAPWAGFLASLGLGLAALEALYLIFVLGQGLAVRRSGAGSFSGDLLHRIGIAFSGSVQLAHGLGLILAVALVVIPLAGAGAEGRAVARSYERRRVATLVIVIVLAVVMGFGVALGVRAELHADHLQQQPTTPFRRWSLATYVVGTLGTALIAFLAALAAFPDRRSRRVETEPPGEPRS